MPASLAYRFLVSLIILAAAWGLTALMWVN